MTFSSIPRSSVLLVVCEAGSMSASGGGSGNVFLLTWRKATLLPHFLPLSEMLLSRMSPSSIQCDADLCKPHARSILLPVQMGLCTPHSRVSLLVRYHVLSE